MDFTERFEKRVAVTGGAGFVGSNLLQYLVPRHPDILFVNIDFLTYAGNLANLSAIEEATNYRFEKLSITEYEPLKACFDRYSINAVINLAAETHVDRSIIGPSDFIYTNLIGTFNLLELARDRYKKGLPFRFHHVSTDEVFGSLGRTGIFNEQSPHRPNSPYSASKAGSDHLVRAYHKTYGLDTVISCSCNNFGPYQFPEKLVPLVIRNALAGESIPVYGDGQNVRQWMYVEDHCFALDLIFSKGASGEVYGVSYRAEMKNIDLVRMICGILDEIRSGSYEDLICFVPDRPGHDYRYALDPSKLETELNWEPIYTFEHGLRRTVNWYIANADWLERCIDGEYRKYYDRNYSKR